MSCAHMNPAERCAACTPKLSPAAQEFREKLSDLYNRNGSEGALFLREAVRLFEKMVVEQDQMACAEMLRAEGKK